MIKISPKLITAYKNISTFLEHLPAGMDYVSLQTKVSKLAVLSKRELDLLLEYIKERDRISVIETRQKGRKSSPLLRHKIFTGELTKVEEKEVEPTKPEVVHVSTPGKVEITPQKNTATTMTPERLRREKLFLSFMPPQVIDGVIEVDEVITRLGEKGATRTDLNKLSPAYRRLTADERRRVLDHLVDHDGFDKVLIVDNKLLPAPRYVVRPKLGEEVVEEPVVATPAIATLAEALAPEDPKVHTPLKLYPAPAEKPKGIPLSEIEKGIIEHLQFVGGRAPLIEFHRNVKGFTDLPPDTRRRFLRNLALTGVIATYQKNGSTVWARLPSVPEIPDGDERPPVNLTAGRVHSTLAQAFKDSKSGEVKASDFPAKEETPKEDEPKEVKYVTPLGRDELVVLIERLQKQLKAMDDESQKELILKELEPVYSEIREQFTVVQNSFVAIGIATETFGDILNRYK